MAAEAKKRWHLQFAGDHPAHSLEDRRKAVVADCDPKVKALIEFLSSSGTGVSKLEALADLATKCKSAEVFVERAASLVPEGTMLKVNQFFAEQQSKAVADRQTAEILTQQQESSTTTLPADTTHDPVDNLSAAEAIDKISRMTSKDRLEAIVVNDQRVTVSKAAQNRLDALAEAGKK